MLYLILFPTHNIFSKDFVYSKVWNQTKLQKILKSFYSLVTSHKHLVNWYVFVNFKPDQNDNPWNWAKMVTMATFLGPAMLPSFFQSIIIRPVYFFEHREIKSSIYFPSKINLINRTFSCLYDKVQFKICNQCKVEMWRMVAQLIFTWNTITNDAKFGFPLNLPFYLFFSFNSL